jgi:aerobic-type carbon monoxide dehydrogenase small subunit (CoxS/CutS family)
LRIELTVNGAARSIEAEPHHTLLRLLREQLNLTGTKECCDAGECGACTILLDGRVVNSCLILAVEADGAGIVTIEGLAAPERLDAVQRAFLDTGAVQCGFCIPGMIVAARSLLDRNPTPDSAAVQEGLSGNLCRCAGYSRIVEAVLQAAREAD